MLTQANASGSSIIKFPLKPEQTTTFLSPVTQVRNNTPDPLGQSRDHNWHKDIMALTGAFQALLCFSLPKQTGVSIVALGESPLAKSLGAGRAGHLNH